ncbi:MAG: SRPBCC domain-containing protein [Acidimicrobiia bacterium]|nr:SRPBCC domain-containing protein [Acidimicrobiia bacterium]MDH3470048.1 SRPBCC domain-containing protein [Acidimicrobiia bacterium]
MAKRSIDTAIEIDAPAEKVWQVFSDFDSYPEWNPFVTSLTGEVAEGGKIAVRLEPPGGKAMTFKPTVKAYQPPQELRWLGKVGFSGVFDGHHQFRVESIDGGKTRFHQKEDFKGILVRPMMRFIQDNTVAGFEALNRALKERAEAKPA